jgi:hypothetical protein
MIGVMKVVLGVALGATLQVSPEEDVAAAIARARPRDVVRLAAGVYRASLGRLAGVAVEGAGAGITVIAAPEGEDGAAATGDVTLRALTIRAGTERCALKVLGGSATLERVALAGGACGGYVDAGALRGRDVDLRGGYGLLVRGGEVAIDGGSARGRTAGVGVVGGQISLRRFAILGPSQEGGLSVARGRARLEGVTIRAPGPSGITVSGGGSVEATAITVAGATESRGMLGDCAQAIRSTLRLEGATLVGCAGAAVEASGGAVTLAGADAMGGAAGCLAFVNGAAVTLEGNLCVGRGPGLVLASGATASASGNRWRTDPALWVDCGSGSRVQLGRGETLRQPCGASR